MKNLLLETEGNITTLTINRPDKLNALDLETIKEFDEAIASIEENNDIRCVIVTGAGDKAFIAGADIEFMKNLNSIEAYEFSRKGHKILQAISDSKKVYIAAVNGYALGGGFEMALACDFIYASKNAKFGFPEVTLGIMPGFGGTQTLARITGKNIARQLIFTGSMIDADYAKSVGVVVDVKENKEELLALAQKTAAKIANNGPIGVAMAKKAINNGYNLTPDEAYKYEGTLFGVLFATKDAKEGLSAFIEKRKPEFKNK